MRWLVVAGVVVAGCGGGEASSARLEGDVDVVSATSVDRLEEFGVVEEAYELHALPLVLRRREQDVLLAFAGLACRTTAPVVTVDVADDLIAIGIDLPQPPGEDCEALEVAWGLELELSEPLGDRRIEVEAEAPGIG